MPLEAGGRLGPYELLDLLGAGGMGEVHRARDTRLDRIVALKLLPAELARGAERRQRFEREAKALARLTHPHICTLYAFERVPVNGHDADVLVLEYLEGETLAARLQRGAARQPASRTTRETSPSGPRPAHALSLAEALAIAIQIAEGLAAAHKQGIVHRDLKPGNVMLTRKSGAGAAAPQVKLLDFGLSKLRPEPDPVSPSDATATAGEPLTGAGALVGTLAYMAPEQLEGRAVDARTDLFALGALVYEMVTGHRAFESDSEAGLIAAILEHEPVPLCERAPLAPPALERVVRKCLSKDPDERWESAHDLADELRWMLEDSGVRASGPASSPPRPRPLRSVARVAAAAVAAVAIGATVVWWLLRPSAAPVPPMRTVPLTSYPGEERHPALSPDGEQVAFTWRGPTGDGPFKLYVKLVDGGDPLLVHEGPGDVSTPTWSPDGRRIAFLRQVEAADDQADTGLFISSALGGAARRLDVFRNGYGVAWSPDGVQLAVSHRETPEAPGAIYLLTVDSAERRRLTEPPPSTQGDFYPRFSPDGTSLAFERRWTYFYSEVFVTALTGGEAWRLTFNRSNLYGFDWTPDGRQLVFSASRPGRPTSSGLWRIPATGGEPTPLEVGDVGRFPGVARSAPRLVYQFGVGPGDIWRVPGPAASSENGARALISSTATDYSPAYSPDDRQVAFSSLRSGYSEIWVASADGSAPRQLTFLEQYSIAPRWSPDGRHLAFFSSADDTFDVYVVGIAGGVPTRVTHDPWNNVGPTWSRDGHWIYFRSDRSGRRELWKIPAGGGAPQQVTSQGGNIGAESPDGRFLYFTKRGAASPGPLGIWRMPAGGGDEERVVAGGFHNLWAVLDSGLCFMTFEADAAPSIEFFEFATGVTRQVAQLPGASIMGLSASSDGQSILYTAVESRSDIMLVENVR